MKKRTTAQRRRAAKNGWMRRRLKMASKPTPLPAVRPGPAQVPQNVMFMDEFSQASAKDKREAAELILGRKVKSNGYGLAAEVSQRLKSVFEWALDQGADPTATQKEATDVICSSLGKLYAGDTDKLVHWEEIAYQAGMVLSHAKE